MRAFVSGPVRSSPAQSGPDGRTDGSDLRARGRLLTHYFHDDHDALTRLETGRVRAQNPLVTRLLDPLEFIHAVAFTAAQKKRRSCLTIRNDFNPPPKNDVDPALKSIVPSHEQSSQTSLTTLILPGRPHTHDLLVSVLWSSFCKRLQRLQVHTLNTMCHSSERARLHGHSSERARLRQKGSGF